MWRTAAGSYCSSNRRGRVSLSLLYRAPTTTAALLHAACIAVDGRPTREACVLRVCVDLTAAAREVEQKGSRYRLLAA